MNHPNPRLICFPLSYDLPFTLNECQSKKENRNKAFRVKKGRKQKLQQRQSSWILTEIGGWDGRTCLPATGKIGRQSFVAHVIFLSKDCDLASPRRREEEDKRFIESMEEATRRGMGTPALYIPKTKR